MANCHQNFAENLHHPKCKHERLVKVENVESTDYCGASQRPNPILSFVIFPKNFPTLTSRTPQK